MGVSGLNPLATRDGIFLFAIPKKLHGDEKTPKEEWFEGKGEGVLKAQLPFHPTRSVSKSDKRDKIATPCKLEIKDGKLTLTLIKEDKPAAKPGRPERGKGGRADTRGKGAKTSTPRKAGGS